MIGFGQADPALINASFGNYSSYYGANNLNVTGKIDFNINKKVKKTVTIKKTIKTIDYSQLALAEAEREKNRLEKLKFIEEKERFIAMQLASDPIKAFDYGKQNNWVFEGDRNGFTSFTLGHRKPHESLFTKLDGYNYQNISKNNITTDIKIWTPYYVLGNTSPSFSYASLLEFGAEAYCKFDNDWKVGTVNPKRGFLHKHDVNRVKVFRHSGFCRTRIYENEYEYIIEDNYYAVYDGIVFHADVTYIGDKDDISFEDLEGRRYYFKSLCNQIISTAFLNDYTKKMYLGEWKFGMKHGKGTYTWSSKEKYVGYWKNDKFHGQGTYTWASGEKYEGEFRKGKFHGQGTYIDASGGIYVGEWKNNMKHGQGTYIDASGKKYVGEWKNDKLIIK
tara:strand:- start:3757 stop:4929 length:1173 start_codon:yes stop_codon:yes gene_type:complete